MKRKQFIESLPFSMPTKEFVMTSAAAPSSSRVWEFSVPGLEQISPAKGNGNQLRLKFSSWNAERQFTTEINFNQTVRKGGVFAGDEEWGGKAFIFFVPTKQDSSYFDLLDLLASAVKTDKSIPTLKIQEDEFARSAKDPYIRFGFKKQ